MPKDCEIVGQDAQMDFAVLAVIGSRSQGGTHVAFEHAEHAFDLPTLATGPLGESLLHQFAISASNRTDFATPGVAAICGRNDTANAQFVTTETD